MKRGHGATEGYDAAAGLDLHAGVRRELSLLYNKRATRYCKSRSAEVSSG